MKILNRAKKVITIMLVLAMVLGMLPAMSMTASAAEETYVTHVDLQMDAPKAGMTAAEYAATIGIDNQHPSSYNVLEVGEVNCTRFDDNNFHQVGTDVSSFVEGGVYQCIVKVILSDDGYSFAHFDSDMTVLVNGQSLENYNWDVYNAYYDNQTYYLTYYVYFTATAADPVSEGITITATTPDKSMSSGWSYVKSSNTLTLDGYNGGGINVNGIPALNLVLTDGSTNTINVSGTNDTYGIGSTTSNNVDLNISGGGGLTIKSSCTGTRFAYGIRGKKITQTGGTVKITAVSENEGAYGVWSSSGVSITGGKLTVEATVRSDKQCYGIYTMGGEILVDSNAVVNVTIYNNGGENACGIFNQANDTNGSLANNGSITLNGTVSVTAASGKVNGIENNDITDNTSGVISVGSGANVTLTDTYYGIASYTRYQAGLAGVSITGGTVTINSNFSDSYGIYSKYNGVSITGGAVTVNTNSIALWLNQTYNTQGIIHISDSAVVDLTSATYKAVYTCDTDTSTRVHNMNFTSGGSFTAKSNKSNHQSYPVMAYFKLGTNTAILQGSGQDNISGTGQRFSYDSATGQVKVAYYSGGSYPDANTVYVNGYPFANPTKLYYKNSDSDTGSDRTGYNAYYNPATGILELKNYNSGPITIGGTVESDITIKLVGNNVINSDSQFGIVNNNGGDITITADSDATLTINVTNGSNYAFGIACDIPGSYDSRSRAITISGKANVTVNATATSTDYSKNAVGISTRGTVAIKDDASFKAVCKSSTSSTGLQSAAGIYGYSGVTINTTGKVDIDVSQCSGDYNYGIYGNASNNLTKVGEMTIKWKQSSGNGAHVLAVGSFDSAAATHAINVDTTNCMATYRYGTPYTVTVNNGSCNAANGKYLAGDPVTVTANTISDLTFKKWNSADATVPNETNATTTFNMPGKDVTVTADYNVFTKQPSFTLNSETDGTISFTMAVNPSESPKLVEKDSDTVVGNQYFSGSTLERSNTVTNGTGTYNVPAGEYRIAANYDSTWFYSDVFTVSYEGTPQAIVTGETVSGTRNEALPTPVDVHILLKHETFQHVTVGDNVNSWFTNLPTGLTADIYDMGSDMKSVTVRINGTPTKVKNETMKITIPADKLVNSGAALNVTENSEAKYAIAESEYALTDMRATVTGPAPFVDCYNGNGLTVTSGESTKYSAELDVENLEREGGSNIASDPIAKPGETFKVQVNFVPQGDYFIDKETADSMSVIINGKTADCGGVIISGGVLQYVSYYVQETVPAYIFSEIDFNIASAAEDAHPAMAATVTGSEALPVSMLASSVEWTDLGTGGNGTTDMSASDTFQAGHYYECRVTFTLSDKNYQFPGAGNLTITANDKTIPETTNPNASPLVSCFAREYYEGSKVKYTVYLRYGLGTGVTVSGTATSWNGTDDAIYRLYSGTTADADIKADIKLTTSGIAGAIEPSSKGTIEANADGKRSDQTFSFEAIADGTYKLAVYKPGGYVITIKTIDVAAADVVKDVELWLLGDVNGDGSVDSTDLNMLFNVVLGYIDSAALSEEQSNVADVNFDKTIDSTDLNVLFNFVLGYIEEL